MARRGLIRNDLDREIIRTGSTAMSEASNACQKFHPLRSDLVVTGAATAADASSSVAYVLIKVSARRRWHTRIGSETPSPRPRSDADWHSYGHPVI